MSSVITRTDGSCAKEPIVTSTRGATQAPNNLARRILLALEAAAAGPSIDSLKQLLADTLTLQVLYKEHLRQASGPNVYGEYLLFAEHCEEQSELVELLAERMETLGDISIPVVDAAEATLISCAPKSREEVVMRIARLLQAHEEVLVKAWAMVRDSAATGGLEINDTIVSLVIRTNESQASRLTRQMQ